MQSLAFSREKTCAKEEQAVAKRARIIVVGCSLFGCAVAQALSAAGHDVIVVDMQEDALDGLGPDFDGETLTGDGKSALVLEECGVRRATHLVAATDDDASNLLIAELASEIFGVPHVLPLVDDDALADILDDMGIPPICPHRICEDEFFRLTGLTRKEADL